jgi:hypothetical protein
MTYLESGLLNLISASPPRGRVADARHCDVDTDADLLSGHNYVDDALPWTAAQMLREEKIKS